MRVLIERKILEIISRKNRAFMHGRAEFLTSRRVTRLPVHIIHDHAYVAESSYSYTWPVMSFYTAVCFPPVILHDHTCRVFSFA